MVAVAELDRARAARDQAGAATRSAEAQLRELTNGTRPEQLEQAAAAWIRPVPAWPSSKSAAST